MSLSPDQISGKSRLAALLWSFLGLHRFYAGSIGTGVLFLITVGGIGIWWVIDIFTIIQGNFKDGFGKFINAWTMDPKHIAPPAILLAIGLIGGITAGSSGGTSTPTTNTNTPTETATETTQETQAETEPAYQLGVPFTKGDLEVTVTRVRKYNKVGSGFIEETPSQGAVFVGVEYTYKNTSAQKTGQNVSVTLVDPAGYAYDAESFSTGTVAFRTQVNVDEKPFSDLNPGLASKGAELYEVATPEIAKPGWILRVRAGGMFEGPIEIALTF